jgi:hypothetical protein
MEDIERKLEEIEFADMVRRLQAIKGRRQTRALRWAMERDLGSPGPAKADAAQTNRDVIRSQVLAGYAAEHPDDPEPSPAYAETLIGIALGNLAHQLVTQGLARDLVEAQRRVGRWAALPAGQGKP